MELEHENKCAFVSGSTVDNGYTIAEALAKLQQR